MSELEKARRELIDAVCDERDALKIENAQLRKALKNAIDIIVAEDVCTIRAVNVGNAFACNFPETSCEECWLEYFMEDKC